MPEPRLRGRVEQPMSAVMSEIQIVSKPSPRLGVPTIAAKKTLKVWVHGPDGRPEQIDLTHALTQAVAHELWRQHAGNSVVNWIQAEAVVDHLADALAASRAAVTTEAKPMARMAA